MVTVVAGLMAGPASNKPMSNASVNNFLVSMIFLR
jgi:hypothetical protein